MSKTNTAVLIIGLIVVGGIAYALTSGNSAMMKEDGGSMMEDKAVLQGDAMMKDSVIKEQKVVTDSEMMIEATSGAMRDSDGMKQVQ